LRKRTLLQQLIYNQELDRAKAPTVNFQGVARVGPTLMQWRTPEQKKRYIPRISAAEEIWCQGLSEPNHGSDLAAVETRAVDMGDYFVVNGSKVWTSNAHRAKFSTPALPHRSRVAQAQEPELPAGRYEDAWHHRPAAPANQRRARLPAWDDGYVRQSIMRFACEAEALKYTSYRQPRGVAERCENREKAM
jgi:alkylation response protein AidB-like acyl-CoA dehydrogenase